MTSVPSATSISPQPPTPYQKQQSASSSPPGQDVQSATPVNGISNMAATAQHPILLNGTPQIDIERKNSAPAGWLPNGNGPPRPNIQFGTNGGSPAPINSVPQGLA